MSWDLREPAPALPRPLPPGIDEEEATFLQPTGPLVLPGKYQVSMALRVDGQLTPVAGVSNFEVYVPGSEKAPPEDLTTLVTFQQKVAKLQRSVSGALELANTTKTNLGILRRALYDTPGAGIDLINSASALDKRLDEILLHLRGDTVLRQRSENTPPSISDRVNGIVNSQRLTTSRPTQTQMHEYDIASGEFNAQLSRLKTLVEVDLRKLEQSTEAAGVPYTPGRMVGLQER